MPTFFQSEFETFAVQRASATRPGALLQLENAAVQPDGTIRTRHGAITNPGAPPVGVIQDGVGVKNVHSLHLRGTTRYFGVGRALTRGNATLLLDNLTDLNRITFADMKPSPATTAAANTYFGLIGTNVTSSSLIADNPTGPATHIWGIDGPDASTYVGTVDPAVGAGVPGTTAVDAMGTAYTIVGTDPGTPAVLTDSSQYEGVANNAWQFTMPADSTGRARRNVGTPNMSLQGEDAFVRIMMRVDNRQHLDHVELAFDVSGGTIFATDYYTTRIAAVEFQTDNTWQEFKIRKTAFERIDPTGGSAKDWSDVTDVQITVAANTRGQVVVAFDDLRVEADTHPEGTYDYKVTYWNDTLKTRSNSIALADIYTGDIVSGYTAPITVQRQSVVLNRPFVGTTAAANVDQQISHWEIWRRNRNAGAGWQFIQQEPIANGTSTDATSDIAAGEGLIDDNTKPPPGSIVVGPYDERMWIMGMNNTHAQSGEEEAPNAIRPSRPSYPESFPIENTLIVGELPDSIQMAVIWGGNLYVWTTARIYQIVGSGGSYFAQATEAPIGTISPYSVAPSPQGIFYRAIDGVYLFTGNSAVKVSGDLDPIFQGETTIIAGATIKPIIGYGTVAGNKNVVGGYAHGKYYLTYEEADGGEFVTLIYETNTRRWHINRNIGADSGWNIRRYSWPRTTASAPVDNLEATTDNGYLVLIEQPGNLTLETTVTDGLSGAQNIPVIVHTKEFDLELKQGDLEVLLHDVMVDIGVDSGGSQAFNVAVALDGTLSSSVSRTASGATGRQKFVIPIGDFFSAAPGGSFARRVAVRVTWTQSASRCTLFGLGFGYDIKPKIVQDWATDYSDEGWAGEKILQELQIDADTGGNNVTVEIEADGTLLTQQYTLNTASQKRQVFSLLAPATAEIHPRAHLLRLIFTAANDWKYFGHQIQVLREPLTITAIETEITDDGWAGEKLYRTLAIDIDPLGAAVSVDLILDGDLKANLITPATTGRDTFHISVASSANPTTADMRGVMSNLRLTSTGTFRYYGHSFDFLREPITNTFLKTEETNEGWEGDKLYRNLALDIDTNGAVATVTVYIDNVQFLPALSVTTTRREQLNISLPQIEIRGKKSYLYIESGTAFGYYGHRFDFLKEPLTATKWRTAISQDGHPGEKLYRLLILDVDAGGGGTLTVRVIISTGAGAHQTTDTFAAVIANARQLVYLNLGATRRGRESVIEIEANTSTQQFRYYGHEWDLLPEPVVHNYLETEIVDDGNPGEKIYRALSIDLDPMGNAATILPFFDGTALAAPPALLTPATADRDIFYFSLANETTLERRGRNSKLRITSPGTFRYYGHNWDLLQEGIAYTFLKTAIQKDGWDAEKLYRTLEIDLDTQGALVTVTAYIDEVAQTGDAVSFTTTTRASTHISFPNTRGRLSSIVISGPSEFFYYGHTWDLLREPVVSTRYITEITEEGWPADKIFRALTLDIDPIGTAVTIGVLVDRVQIESFTSPATSGRQTLNLSLAKLAALERRGRNVNIDLSSSGTFRYYGHTFEFEKEPIQHTFFKTTIQDDNWMGEKLYRTLNIDINTRGTNVTVTPHIDGVAQTATTVNVSGRQDVHISYPNIRGRNSSIVIEAATATAFSYYGHEWDYEKEPITSTIYITQYTTYEWPGKKAFRQFFLEIDTQGQNVSANIIIDGTTTNTFTANTSARRSLIFSFHNTPEGRIVQLDLRSDTTTRFRYYGHSFDIVRRPLDITFFNSLPLNLMDGKQGWLRRGYLILAGSQTINGIIYVNGVSQHTFTVSPTAGQASQKVSFPVGLSGEVFQLTLDSSGTFQLFPESQIQVKRTDTDHQFLPWKLTEDIN